MTLKDRHIFRFQNFRLETNGGLLFRDETVVPLEPQAARVLIYLLENNARLVSKDELLENVWRDVFTTDDVLKKSVSQIRRALGDDSQKPRFIETFHRRGYRFIAPIDGEKFTLEEEKTKNHLVSPPPPAENDDPDFDRFVGRQAEMEILQAGFRRAIGGGGAQPVLIVGEPGIGKTQLATRFEDWARAGAHTLDVRFFDYEAAHLSSYELFLDLLREALSGGADAGNIDLPEAARTRLKVELPAELFNAEMSERFRTQSDALRFVVPIAECFVRLSRENPLVLILDDLQWADDAGRRIVGYLMRAAGRERLQIIALARRREAGDAAHSLAGWLQAQAVYRSFTMIELHPLSENDYRSLLAEIFRGRLETERIPPSDWRRLHLATGGNPYFLIETVRLLIAENRIEKNGVWHWRGLSDVPLPETIRMAARATLHRLPARTQEFVEHAAVLGDAFQIETLAETFAADETEFENCLDEAVAARVLTERNVSGTDDCRFYHTTLRRAVYGDLSPRRLKRLHLRAARAIGKKHHKSLDRVAAALGSHYHSAHDWAASFEWNLRAARLASLLFDWTEAFEFVERARRAAAVIAPEEFSAENSLRLLLATGEIFMSTGRRAEAEKSLVEAVSLAEKSADEKALAAACQLLGQTRILLSKYREAAPFLERALQLSEKSGDIAGIANARLQLASAKYALCEYEASAAMLQTVIDEAGEIEYQRAVALGKLGWIRALQSRYTEAKRLLERALEFHRTAGDVRERATLAMCLNWCEYGVGRFQSAVEFASRARAEAQTVGEPYNESVAMMRIGKARIAQGLYAEAGQILTTALENHKDLNAEHCRAETVWMLGRLKNAVGEYAEAEILLADALETVQKVGDREDEFRILIDRAELQINLKNFEAALALAVEAEKIAVEIEVADGAGAALVEQSFAFLHLENSKAAHKAAERAVEIFEHCASGPLWRAFYALALASLKSQSADLTKGESALRRSLALLAGIREEFPPENKEYRRLFTLAHKQPAAELIQLLISGSRHIEAEEITRQWAE